MGDMLKITLIRGAGHKAHKCQFDITEEILQCAQVL